MESMATTSDFLFQTLINTDDSVTSTATDVIFDGRILPFAPPLPRRSLSLSSASCRRSESLTSNTQLTRSAFQPSRSLNSRKLRRISSSKAELLSNCNSDHTSTRVNRTQFGNHCRSCNCDHCKAAVGGGMKPPWYLMVFGLPVKIPAEIEVKDIKSRLCRRSMSTPGSFSGDRSSSASWKLLSVLSCKRHASVDVRKTTSFRI